MITPMHQHSAAFAELERELGNAKRRGAVAEIAGPELDVALSAVRLASRVIRSEYGVAERRS